MSVYVQSVHGTRLAKGLFVLFRLIEAECGLCCDVKCGIGGGGAKGFRQTSQDLRGRIGRRENKKGVSPEKTLYGTLCLFALASSRVRLGRLSRRDVAYAV